MCVRVLMVRCDCVCVLIQRSRRYFIGHFSRTSGYIIRTYLRCFSYHRRLLHRLFPRANSPLYSGYIRGILETLCRNDEAPRSSPVRFLGIRNGSVKGPARGSVCFHIVLSLVWVCSAHPLAACIRRRTAVGCTQLGYR